MTAQSIKSTKSDSKGALHGVRVLDLSRVFAGPFCTQVLADHGAEVIKLEPPQGDETRDWGVLDKDRHSSYFWGLNRNKRTLALDLRLPQAQSLVLRLLQDTDVLVDNFKQGSMERWSLGANDLAVRFPRLVQLSISGFGPNGPLAGFPGYDAVIQAFCGLMSVNGVAGGDPTKLPLPLVDFSAGLYASNAIALALYERERSGLGQRIEVTLFDVALSMTHPLSTGWMFDGKVPAPSGNVYAQLAPYGVYTCKNRVLFIGAGNNSAFAKLCTVLEQPALAQDPRFNDNCHRLQHREALDTLLNSACAQWLATDLERALLQKGVAAAVINNLADVFTHPQTKANGMCSTLGVHPVVPSPMKLKRTPARLHSAPPHFAQDTDAILQSLGFDPEQIKHLEQLGVLLRKRI